MSDYDNVIDDYFEAPARQAALSIDDSPDRAVRARQLSKATGQPQLAVYNDLDRADQEHKADLSRMIVGRNDKLSAYIRGEPLAAVVSNDDYGNLDNLSKEVGDLTSISGITKHILSDVFRAPIKGAEVMAEQAMQPYWFNKNFPEFAAKNPYSTALYNLPEAALRTLSIPFAGIAGAAGEYAKTAVTAITADPMQGERAGRDIGGMVDYYFMGVTGHMPHTYGEMVHAKQFDNAVRSSQREFYHEALAAAKPYLDAGLEVPRGVHPLVDSLKANVNAEWVDKAEKVLNSSFDSATKERDPDLFHSYSKIEFEDSQMGISGDRVAALYGDKLPTPDDGLLGWVPGIKEKLEAARMFGEDVHVSMADWLTHMDPQLFKDLKDDIRAWPGGITKNEAALKDVAAPAVDGALPQVRTSAALEPMFAIGDRPLKLEKLESKYKQMEEYNFVDHTGKVIGDITIFPDPLKKQLYIASVASHDLQPNTMGPSLVRDIKRQLKELYPDYETVTGYRISGAREEAGAPKDQRKPIVKLALSDAFEMSKEYNDLRNILDTAPTKFGDVTADIKPTELYSKHEQAIGQAVQEEINRITGKTAEPVLASDIRYEGIDGIRGVYHKAPGEVAKILVSLGDFDATGIARHEAIHHLYREGFFKPEEWNALIEASKTEGWRERYDIDARYEHLNELGLHEEAIAEAFRDWAKTREQQPHNPVTTVFQKIWDLMQRIKDRVAEILGREPTFNELFEQAFTGELAQRGQGEVRPGDMFSKGEVEAKLKAEAVGLDAKHKKKLDELLQKEYEENLAAAVKRAEAEQRTLQSKEWKEAAREIRKESEADVRARPDVQADLLIGSGELGGKKLERNRYELRSEDLSPEQKATLPRHYYAKDGVPVDVMANLFGYSDGNHLIEALAEVNKGKEGRSAQENLKRLIDEETNRRMEEKFGKLQDNIMLDAMDQAFSETALNRIAEEWQGAAMQAGVQVIDKNLAKDEAQRIFSNMKVADINVERLIGIMGKLGRDAERSLIAGKYADASVLMQRKYSTALIIAEAKKLEKERAGFDRTYNQMRKREIKSMEPEYTDMVHQIYQLIDKPVQRSIQDLQDSLARNEYKNLADFVEKKQNALRVVDAWEPLMEGNWKKSFNDLTVDEFRGVNGTIKNLVHNGKEERKIYKAGEAADFAELKGEFIQSIVDAAHGDFAKLNKGKYAKLPEQYFVQHIQMETFLNRLDGYDPNGVWFQYVYRDLADGAAQVDIWRKHFSKRLKDVPQPKNLHRTLDNPLFKDQDTGLAIPFTRRNLIAVMLNTGNSTNLKKLAESYKLRSDDIMAWVNQHATKAEFDYVQHIWDVFAEIKEKSDTMYRALSGVAPENIEIRPIDTPHGQYKGGYYPLIRDPNQVGQGSGKVFGRDALLQENFVSAMPPAGYTKKRTGAIYPLSLEPDMMTNQMSQMLHDIGMRPALINASKIMMNKEIQSKIRAHFGDAWKDELKDYLVGVANAQNYMPQNQKAIMELAEFARQNVISTVIGFNPSTVMKHGPTALGLSIKEVGLKNFVKAAWETDIFRNIIAEVAPERYRSAVRSLLGVNDITSNKTWNFIRENSLEIARRDRNWEETLFGATAGLQPFDGYMTWRAKVMQLASKPVALSDMLSAAPTWLAAYKEAQAAGKDHGESVAFGDRAVRRAHGSTASTSRTSFQRNYNPYLTSVYNFWSDILNRQVETIWMAGDIYKLTEGNPVQKGLATVPTLAGGLLAYSIWPAIVESHVSPHPHGDDESFVWRALKQFAFTEMGGWVGIRDAATAFAFARDPHYGLTGTAWQGLTNLPRDLLRKEPLNKERAGKLIQDGAALMGTLTGSFPLQIGKSARYVYGVKSGQENPRNVWQWLVGLRFGTNDKHSRSFEEYWKGKH